MIRILLSALLADTPVAAAGVDVDVDVELSPHAEAARILRIRRMASTWADESVEVTTRSGARVDGRLLRVNQSVLLLSPGEGAVQQVPLRDLYRISVKKRPSDLVFVAVLALGVGALFAGTGALGFETDEMGMVSLGAGGALIGATIGWNTVYQDRVITFE